MNPDECFASGSERNTHYHYEFLFHRGFITRKRYYDYVGACTAVTDPFRCYQMRQIIDKDVNATNTSAYNIYGKCYNTTKANTINLGCEDETGATAYFNDVHFK